MSLRVLVADGNVDAADSVARLLTLWGYDTQIAYRAADALKVADYHDPDVTLLDVVLPEEGGVQVAERLRGRTTLIAVTGIGYEDFQRCYPGAGFSHYLQKPVSPELLHRLLRSLERPGQDPSPSAEPRPHVDRPQRR